MNPLKRRPGWSRRRIEAGFATVWAAWWILVILAVGLVGALGAAVLARQHHVDGAADLVAISGAHRLSSGADPCAEAARIAAANRVGLEECRVDGSDVVIIVSDGLALPFGLDATITGRARAGPSVIAGS